MTTAADTPTGDEPAIRLGVLRPDDTSTDLTVATMVARVVRAEFERRIGPVTLDLRTAGRAVGPWLPRDHAAWPSDVDAQIDLADIDGAPDDLVALFGRTIEPTAAEVRERMLRFLLPLDHDTLTDDLLAELLPAPARPTDVWLVVRGAATVATSEPALELLRLEPGNDVVIRLDRWFDAVARDLERPDTAEARLRAEVAELRSRLAEAENAMVRTERLALDRLTDLETERASLRERLERVTLDGDMVAPGGTAG
jgi:hypothetical protein